MFLYQVPFKTPTFLPGDLGPPVAWPGRRKGAGWGAFNAVEDPAPSHLFDFTVLSALMCVLEPYFRRGEYAFSVTQRVEDRTTLVRSQGTLEETQRVGGGGGWVRQEGESWNARPG